MRDGQMFVQTSNKPPGARGCSGEPKKPCALHRASLARSRLLFMTSLAIIATNEQTRITTAMSHKKSQHFSEIEKQVLLALVQEYAGVLESKKSDGRTVDLKKRAWEELTVIYNANGEVLKRDSTQKIHRCPKLPKDSKDL